MEKIQSALAKARESRSAVAPSSSAPPPGSVGAAIAAAAAQGPSADEARIAAEWHALRELRIDPEALSRAHVVTAMGGRDSAPFDVMRTKMLHQMRSNGWRRVAITSPGPGCGKSTIALNLAFSLARQPDLRILVAEADLHRPTLARTLGIRAQSGVAEVLQGAADPGDVACRHGSNLAFLTSPGSRRSPAELFQAPRTAEVLDALEARFDPTLTIFDLPPMMIGDDVMSFAGHVDCVLLIAAAEATTIAQLDACERELATRTNVLGIVLNKCRYLGNEQGYGYYG